MPSSPPPRRGQPLSRRASKLLVIVGVLLTLAIAYAAVRNLDNISQDPEVRPQLWREGRTDTLAPPPADTLALPPADTLAPPPAGQP